MKNLYFFLGILVLLLSCNEKPASEKTNSDKKTAFKETQKILSEDAYILNENFPKYHLDHKMQNNYIFYQHSELIQ